MEVDGVGGGVRGCQSDDRHTVGNIIHENVVEIGVAVFVVEGTDGDIAAAIAVAMHEDGEFFPSGQRGGSNRIDDFEGGGFVGVGNHTHFEAVRIGGVGFVEPEADLQRVE